MLEVQSRLYRQAHGLDFVTVVPARAPQHTDARSEKRKTRLHALTAPPPHPALRRRTCTARTTTSPCRTATSSRACCTAACSPSAPAATQPSSSQAPARRAASSCAQKTHTRTLSCARTPPHAPAPPDSYAPDLARLILEALRRYSSPEPLILAPDEADEVSIGDVARAIGAALRFGGETRFDAAQADGQLRKTAANGRLRATLLSEGGGGAKGYPFRFTPLAEGLAATAAWFEANYEAARK
jgi:hypothetical protein